MRLSWFWVSLSQGNSGKEILYPEFVAYLGGKEKLLVPAMAQIKTLSRLLKHQQMGQLSLSSQPVSRPRLSIGFISWKWRWISYGPKTTLKCGLGQWVVTGLHKLVLSSPCDHCSYLKLPQQESRRVQSPTDSELITFQVHSFTVICGSDIRKQHFSFYPCYPAW